MVQQTEAACLLESGALYGRRVLLRPSEGAPIFAGFKAGAFSLYFGDEPIYHFDGEGRWQRAYVEGVHYLKGLDTTIRAIDRVREGGNLILKRRTLDDFEAAGLDARVRSTALELIDALESSHLERVDPPKDVRPLDHEPLREFLQAVSRWDATRWAEDRQTYRETYGPLPLLPPECQNAVILQATVGNAGGRAFGGGAVSEHHARPTSVFEDHVRAVSTLLGRRVLQCRNLFLGGSDVLRRAVSDVVSYLETIGRVFPISEGDETSRSRDMVGGTPTLEGIHSFLDDFGVPGPGLQDWKRFRELHLRRITLGVESGDSLVRGLYGKGWKDDDLIATVADAKQAGLGVSLAVLVGAGGLEHSGRHLTATTELLQALPLGQGDLVALLDAEEIRDPQAGDSSASPLVGRAWDEQQARFKQALTPLRTGRGVKVMPYLLEKQGGS